MATKKWCIETLDEASSTLRKLAPESPTVADEEYIYELAAALEEIQRFIRSSKVRK